ncbi:DNA polymerase III subunit delta [Candidatus Photodesmus blepharus]|uniref:DNA polymerase III subunit delta n=1 Tax=Candidatus Photodesmus blepharonis TaxID=1179155 RepID=A0A084CPJ3_9GAMM|nr:DNA polymerase III subunit delta [Candidatus Photodesmus blepharus]KEY91722.1 DNA polymerase III subunit delta [Candidatus Photodesmus blepharus]
MDIFSDRLPERLNKQLQSIYLLLGNEPLLRQEARQAINKKAKQHGFSERRHFYIDTDVNWDQLYYCIQSFSLFSSKRIIELEVSEIKINPYSTQKLISLIEILHNDIILIIISSKLNTQWLKAFKNRSCCVNCFAPDTKKLPQFVQARCQKLGLKADYETLKVLAQWYEGNLLALSQSLEKLNLLYPDRELNLVRVKESLSRNNHFTSLHWIDALLENKPNRAQRILQQLRVEGMEVTTLIRTIQKELLKLLQIKYELNTSTFLQLFDKHQIRKMKRSSYFSTLSRLSSTTLKKQLKLLTKCEILAKTRDDTSAWPLLYQLSMQLCSSENYKRTVHKDI